MYKKVQPPQQGQKIKRRIAASPSPTKLRKCWRKCGWLRSIFAYIKRYFSVSGIHGFAYLARDQLTLFERCFWLLLLILSLSFCIFTGIQAIQHYRHKNTVMAIERDFYFWRTNLPSLTVCPMQRLNQELFDKFCLRKKIEGRAKDEFQQFLESLANSTYINFANITVLPSIDSTIDRLRLHPEKYMSLIYSLTIDYAQVANISERVNVTDGYKDMQVRQVLTEFGLCYMTNNMLDHEYSARFMVSGKMPKVNKQHMPVLSGNYFEKSILYVMTLPRVLGSIGVYLHSPSDVLRIEQNLFYARVAAYSFTEARDITTDPLFEKETTISQRNCRFPHESNLTHFPIYTRSLCMQECRLNLVYRKCRCIPHFYPNRIPQPKRVCSYIQLKSCVANNAEYFRRLHSEKKRKIINCPCQPSCQGSIVIVKKLFSAENLDHLQKGCSATIETQTWPYVLLKRQVIFTFTDLLVSIGGTAGLFLGFSVLGATEFVYYFTLRLICYLRGYRY